MAVRRMYAFVVMNVLGVGLALLPAWWAAQQRDIWYPETYLLPLAPALALVLLMSGVGSSPSLSNAVVELALPSLLVVLSTWIRVAAAVRWQLHTRRVSLLIFLAAVAFPLLLRISLPTLPE